MKKKKREINTEAYMVLVQGRGEPRSIHTLLATALEESERLANREPNKLVRVLKIVAQIRGEVTPINVPLEFPHDDNDVEIPPF